MKNNVKNADLRPLAEHEIREALLCSLRLKLAEGQQIEEEFRIERGAARVDVAVLGAQLSGYEIKSDFDTLKRLSNQIHAYNRVFDEISIVCGGKLAEVALAIMPSWWGIIYASRMIDGGVELSQIRAPSQNSMQEAMSLAALLWREEAVSILQAHDRAVSPKAASAALSRSLTEILPIDRMKLFVRQSLLTRNYNRSRVKTM